MHIFYVQGGGLGHLTRTDRLIKTLNISSEDVLIITPSIYTHYFEQYNCVNLSWSDTPNVWTNRVLQVINTTIVEAFYVDAFPFGIQSELVTVFKTFPDLIYIYVARLLKWDTYINITIKDYDFVFSKTFVLEDLYPTHQDWIIKNSKQHLHLQLDQDYFPLVKFSDQPYVMVVHSGGQADVLKLIDIAITNNLSTPNLQIVVFTQVAITISHTKVIILNDVYPVKQYYRAAEKIYTAAGFNSINELKAYKSKHIAIPLDKLYDDQFFRVKHRTTNS